MVGHEIAPDPPAIEQYDRDTTVIVETRGSYVWTHVIIRDGGRYHYFDKVHYNWGPIFYFKDRLSINATMFRRKTGLE